MFLQIPLHYKFIEPTGCTNDGILLAKAHLGRAHITNLQFTMGSIDKDVVAFDVSVDDGRGLAVKVGESL